MLCRITDMHSKEVINVCDGTRLDASRISFTVHISILSFRSNDLFMSGGGVFPV